jgi:sigma-B regulation protein RsbU (phosphoserine phosphatase)
MRISIKYKLLAVFLLLIPTGIATFFFITRRTFLQDKKLFILDWSLANLRATTNEMRFELRTRLDNLQVFLPRLYQFPDTTSLDEPKLQLGLSSDFPKEVFLVSFLQKRGTQYKVVKTYFNRSLLEANSINTEEAQSLNLIEPNLLEQVQSSKSVDLLNQSLNSNPILTLIMSSSLLNDESAETLILVNFSQDFLQQTLTQNKLAEQFLLKSDGSLVSHPESSVLLNSKTKGFQHPILERLNSEYLPRESIEVEINGEDYLVNFSSVGLGNIFLITQLKRKDAFQALSTLAWQTLQVGLFILSLAFILSVIFSAGLTRGIQQLERAAKEIGSGNLNTKLELHSKDEVESVANTFNWMTGRIVALLKETAEKARMEEELATASLIQNTILTPPEINIQSTEVVPYYKSATECGGDLWDVFVKDGKLTVLLGDATGHGAPAAIVTAVVKSCITTLNAFHHDKMLSPSEMLTKINSIVYQSCKGELLMTMSVVQLDLSTGLLTVSNAGHEAPLLVRSATEKKHKAEPLFVRGERLGFTADTKYDSTHTQLQPGDTILIYSDGISEAANAKGAVWGERALRTIFASNSKQSLQEIKSSILSALETFTAGTPQKDDVTFVLFGWKKRASSEHLGAQAA